MIGDENPYFSGELQECVGFVAGVCGLRGSSLRANVLWNNNRSSIKGLAMPSARLPCMNVQGLAGRPGVAELNECVQA